MAWLNISGDKGKVTDGKAFTLDDDQLEVVNTFAEVIYYTLTENDSAIQIIFLFST